jgi:hypothetical protein
MARHGWRAVLAAGLLWILPSQALAHTTEYRDYVISVDGKEAGKTTVSITAQDDGTMVMCAKAAVRVNKGVFSYAYDVHATEWWKADRLVGIKVNANDNGKRTEVVGSADGDHLRLRVNARERLVRHDLWVNSFWKLADARFHNNSVPVLDADSGQEYTGQLKYIGAEQVMVANQPLKTFHFRVTGGNMTHELWFDESHRLVRQEFVEQGRRVTVVMTAMRR